MQQTKEKQYISYENYNVTSQNYDATRRAIGMNFIEATLQQVAQKKGVNVKDLTVLDAGCGTGNYTVHLHEKVGQYIGVEFNDGMVKKFKEKFDSVENITLYQRSVFDTGLPDGIADVIIMNQVIHHLDTSNKERSSEEMRQNEYPNISKTLKELYRLLKVGGAISVNFTPVEQMFGVWYINHCHPKEKTEKAWNTLCPNIEKMRTLLGGIGYQSVTFDKCLEPFMYQDFYFNLQGPFSKQYRDGDSFWSMISAQEVEECQERLRGILSSQNNEEFLEKIKKELQETGQSTTVSAYKV